MSIELRKSLITSSAIAIVLFFLTNAKQGSCQEVEDEREFSYKRGSETGPEHWGEIHPEWVACGVGQMQSPIDLASDRVRVDAGLGQLRRTYGPAKAAMRNRGHDIEIKWEEDGGGMWVNETYYTLRQVHWHSPSEHTINGIRYELELHMVHESKDNRTAVIGIVYTIGRPDSFITTVEKFIEQVKDMEDKEVPVGKVDASLIGMGMEYYRYMGSLTTPPCTEGVTWTVIQKKSQWIELSNRLNFQALTVSSEQIQLLRDAVDNESNSRPIQQINERMIDLFEPRKSHL